MVNTGMRRDITIWHRLNEKKACPFCTTATNATESRPHRDDPEEALLCRYKAVTNADYRFHLRQDVYNLRICHSFTLNMLVSQ